MQQPTTIILWASTHTHLLVSASPQIIFSDFYIYAPLAPPLFTCSSQPSNETIRRVGDFVFALACALIAAAFVCMLSLCLCALISFVYLHVSGSA